jgi:CubicO group peptidase (beta-lactamase class C family)
MTNMNSLGGFGGLYSTVGDMLIWDKALMNRRLLSANSQQAMFTDYGHNYGFGWRFATKFGRRLVWHTGNDQAAGFAAITDYFPGDEVAVIALSNNTGLTSATATLVIAGKPVTFPATAMRELVEGAEHLYFIGKN